MFPTSSQVGLCQALGFLRANLKHWLLPAMVVSGAAAVFAAVHSPYWEASQALIIRNEATAEDRSPGKFSHPEEMKTVQETILELARSNGVLAAALREVGPPADHAGPAPDWPSARDLAQLRSRVRLVPPKGAEFGKTEVFYLQVRDTGRGRAVALVSAICSQLESRFQQLRDAKARSMIDELVKAVNLARADLQQSTQRLREIETQAGADLAELRILQDGNNGESPLRRTLTEIRAELRQARTALKSHEQLLALLDQVQKHPNRLVSIPNQLIESQPALRRLKEGLAEAQLRTAQLSGAMSESHPLVQAARESEREICRNLRQELVAAVAGLQIDVRLQTERIGLLEEQLAKTTDRLDRLAGLRAPYANQVAETRHRTTLLERAEQRLAEARASEATAKAASLIARIDEPDTGAAPVGPGRATIALAGIVGGLLAGLGLVLLTARPLPSAPDRVGPAAPSAHAGDSRVYGNGQAKRAPSSLSLNQALQKIGRG